jgi:transposase
VLTLEDRDRETLTRWTRRPKTALALAQRARIVLAGADGRPNDAIARELSITPHTVGKWRRRYLERGPDGLLDEPRPGAPRTIGDDRIEAVIARTLEQKPRDATHWSTRSMARSTGVSQSTVVRIWRAFGLQPHRA